MWVTYLPVIPALGIDDPTIWQWQEELASLILDVYKAMYEIADVLDSSDLRKG